MSDSKAPLQIFDKSITIHAAAETVWNALTIPALMNKWMSETGIEIITDWKVGGSITIKGDWYKTGFINTGKVLQFKPGSALTYTHLSSLSRLDESEENYAKLEFELQQQDGACLLTFRASNFATEAIYRHFVFYWNVALELLKRFVEKEVTNQSPQEVDIVNRS